MEFADKYSIIAGDINPDTKEAKIVLSTDAYAIGEMINKLINKIEQTRLTLQ